MLLRIAFAVAPIALGIDKFAGVLTDDWTKYLAAEYDDVLPGSASDAPAGLRPSCGCRDPFPAGKRLLEPRRPRGLTSPLD